MYFQKYVTPSVFLEEIAIYVRETFKLSRTSLMRKISQYKSIS